jgi:hypothetical protein
MLKGRRMDVAANVATGLITVSTLKAAQYGCKRFLNVDPIPSVATTMHMSAADIREQIKQVKKAGFEILLPPRKPA